MINFILGFIIGVIVSSFLTYVIISLGDEIDKIFNIGDEVDFPKYDKKNNTIHL